MSASYEGCSSDTRLTPDSCRSGPSPDGGSAQGSSRIAACDGSAGGQGRAGNAFGRNGLGIAVAHINQIIASAVSEFNSAGQQLFATWRNSLARIFCCLPRLPENKW